MWRKNIVSEVEDYVVKKKRLVMSRYDDKKICQECPRRALCVELIQSEICPYGLQNIPLERAREIQVHWPSGDECGFRS
jgi:hypothetical protein